MLVVAAGCGSTSPSASLVPSVSSTPRPTVQSTIYSPTAPATVAASVLPTIEPSITPTATGSVQPGATFKPTEFSFGLVAADGTLILSSCDSNRIYQVGQSGNVEVVGGTGDAGSDGDGGPATAARFTCPIWMALDSAGNLFVVERGANRVRKIDSGGIVTKVAGTGLPGFSGDGGPAIDATLDFPTYLAVDHAGNVYIADRNNDRVRRVDTQGIITTVRRQRRQRLCG